VGTWRGFPQASNEQMEERRRTLLRLFDDAPDRRRTRGRAACTLGSGFAAPWPAKRGCVDIASAARMEGMGLKSVQTCRSHEPVR